MLGQIYLRYARKLEDIRGMNRIRSRYYLKEIYSAVKILITDIYRFEQEMKEGKYKIEQS